MPEVRGGGQAGHPGHVRVDVQIAQIGVEDRETDGRVLDDAAQQIEVADTEGRCARCGRSS
ncbi:hypothetical protein ABZ357_07860 [Streptomyces sp. NPDC005917]|uniref:hypothetical protein n=1 Tax=Streptomyces sp. NPDC005917 TaxID=3155347 RepID=UPI0033FF2686